MQTHYHIFPTTGRTPPTWEVLRGNRPVHVFYRLEWAERFVEYMTELEAE